MIVDSDSLILRWKQKENLSRFYCRFLALFSILLLFYTWMLFMLCATVKWKIISVKFEFKKTLNTCEKMRIFFIYYYYYYSIVRVEGDDWRFMEMKFPQIRFNFTQTGAYEKINRKLFVLEWKTKKKKTLTLVWLLSIHSTQKNVYILIFNRWKSEWESERAK